MRFSAHGVDSLFRSARSRLAPGLVLGQKLTGRGAWEQSASGSWIELSNGRRMLDFGSYAVPLFGHRHPEVTAAVHDQLDRMPTSTRVLANPCVVELAERLMHILSPSALSRVWFGLNGCDAVEVALKLARAATGRSRILAVEGAFHGKSLGALAATSNPRYRDPVGFVLAPATHLPLEPDAVRKEVAKGDVAALIFEPIQGEGGVVPLEPKLLRRWCHDARDAGVFVVSDEIQVGLGRCGPMSLAHQEGIEPDAVLFGKALGGGVMPLSAAVCTEQLFAPMIHDPFFHSSVFSGHPLSCAAGLVAVDLVDRLSPSIRAAEHALAERLAAFISSWPDLFLEYRGRGLLWGIECIEPKVAGQFLMEVNGAGLLVSPCLSRPEVIRLLPPATVGLQELEFAFAALADAAAATRTWLGQC